MDELEYLIKYYMLKYEAPYEAAEQWALQDYEFYMNKKKEPELYYFDLC